MKFKLMGLIILMLLIAGILQAEPRKVTVYNFVSGTIIASGTYTSPIYEIKDHTGFFSYQATVTGTGTAKIQYQVSNNKTNWTTGTTDIVTAATVGTALYAYTPELSLYQRFLITETGGANSVAVESWMANQ